MTFLKVIHIIIFILSLAMPLLMFFSIPGQGGSFAQFMWFLLLWSPFLIGLPILWYVRGSYWVYILGVVLLLLLIILIKLTKFAL
jgi:hypothetical protein